MLLIIHELELAVIAAGFVANCSHSAAYWTFVGFSVKIFLNQAIL